MLLFSSPLLARLIRQAIKRTDIFGLCYGPTGTSMQECYLSVYGMDGEQKSSNASSFIVGQQAGRHGGKQEAGNRVQNVVG